MKNTRLVYSTDPKDSEVCPKCKELKPECLCIAETDQKDSKFIAKLRIEKAGRNGKTVTVIDELPKIELYLKDLTKELKAKCGSGGTYDTSGKEGRIEIQGDKRDVIRTLLTRRNIKFKG